MNGGGFAVPTLWRTGTGSARRSSRSRLRSPSTRRASLASRHLSATASPPRWPSSQVFSSWCRASRHLSSWPRWSSPRCAQASGGVFSPRRFCTGISGTSSATLSALVALGTLVEAYDRRARAPLAYLAGAIVGSLASTLLLAASSVGASAGVLGLLGFLLMAGGEATASRAWMRKGLLRLMVMIAATGLVGLLLHRQRWPCWRRPRGCLRRCAQRSRQPDRWRVAAPSRRRRFRRRASFFWPGQSSRSDACCARGDRGPRAVSGIARARTSGMVSPGRDCARDRALALFALLGPLHRPAADLSRQLSPRLARPRLHALPGASGIALGPCCASRLGADRRVHRVAVVADRRLRTVRLPRRGSAPDRRRARRGDAPPRARSHATIRRLDPAGHGDWLHRLRVGRTVLRPRRARASSPIAATGSTVSWARST